MKILILTSIANRHYYFASKIAHGLQGDEVFLIQESKSSKGKNKSKLSKFFKHKHKILLLKNIIINFIFKKYLQKVMMEKKVTENLHFGSFNKESLNNINIIDKVEDGKTINDIEYVKKIQDLQPDIIVVMGTSLIKDKIINIPRLGILNIHTGVSPYYRGGMTNFWPFIYNELEYCGVTVHKLDIGIDSGEIIYHGFVDIEESDTYSSINCKAIIDGTKLMIQAIKDLKGNNLQSVQQENGGRLFYNRDYNGYYAYKYINSYQQVIKNFLNRS